MTWQAPGIKVLAQTIYKDAEIIADQVQSEEEQRSLERMIKVTKVVPALAVDC